MCLVLLFWFLILLLHLLSNLLFLILLSSTQKTDSLANTEAHSVLPSAVLWWNSALGSS